MPRPQYTVRGTVSTNGQTTDLSAVNLRTVIASDSGGGTSNFLRADGTWAAPAGGPGGEPQSAVTATTRVGSAVVTTR